MTTNETDYRNTPISELSDYKGYTVAELEAVIDARAALKAQEMITKQIADALAASLENDEDGEANGQGA